MAGSRIIIECPECGTARVAIGEVTIRSALDVARFTYRARCPQCARCFVAPTTGDAALRAVVAGAPVEYWSTPAEWHERPGGPPFSERDVVMLRRLLDAPDWFDRLRRARAAFVSEDDLGE